MPRGPSTSQEEQTSPHHQYFLNGGVTAGFVLPRYSTFKAAILNLTKHLSGAYAKHGILVNGISPGIIHTEGWELYISIKVKAEGIAVELCSETENKRASENVPLKRLGKVREVADLTSFLASDQGSFIAVSNHRVEGGRVLSI